MKYALVNGDLVEAQTGLAGRCRGCGAATVAKCGPTRVWHWAHQGRRDCDPWRESETPWHRAWKDLFPKDWQEVVHRADDGELHFADVKTGDGWVLEFQHSRIAPDERLSREAFYEKLVWVVDGLRRKRDLSQFMRAWNEGVPTAPGAPVSRVVADGCALLSDWIDSPIPIFLDFGEEMPLAFVLPTRSGGSIYVYPLRRDVFVGIHRATGTEAASGFHAFIESIRRLVETYEGSLRRASRSVGIPAHREPSRVRRRSSRF